MTTSIRDLLRSATAASHAEVDARFSPLVAGGAANYAEFLRATAAAVYPLERALGAAAVMRLLPDWEQRARSAALRADLTELGIPEPSTPPAPPLGGDASLFGVLYVLEGSRLGAKLLTRQLLANATPRARGAMRYLRHGEGKPLWQTFLERLESSVAVRRAPDQAIAGASAAFGCFGASAMSARPARQIEIADAG